MALFNKKTNSFEVETSDLLIVFDNDNKTSDIKEIDYIEDNALTVEGFYKIPLSDCEVTVGKDGRNFFYRAPEKSITEVERLAKLEHNLVLTQITSYEPPEDHSGMDVTKWLLFGLLFFAFIAMIFIG